MEQSPVAPLKISQWSSLHPAVLRRGVLDVVARRRFPPLGCPRIVFHTHYRLVFAIVDPDRSAVVSLFVSHRYSPLMMSRRRSCHPRQCAASFKGAIPRISCTPTLQAPECGGRATERRIFWAHCNVFGRRPVAPGSHRLDHGSRHRVLDKWVAQEDQGRKAVHVAEREAQDRRGGTEAEAGRRDSVPTPHQVFGARAWARAYLWQTEEFDLHGAVDALAVSVLDTDVAQAILSRVFGAVRGGHHEPPRAPDADGARRLGRVRARADPC
jgi:hypothetical protein